MLNGVNKDINIKVQTFYLKGGKKVESERDMGKQ